MPTVMALSIVAAMSVATRRRRSGESSRIFRRRTPRGPKRLRWILAATALILAALVWWLPAIVARTPLLQWALAAATKDLDGAVHVESASLGWFSPIVARGIEVRNRQDQPVLEATQVTGNKSLAAILLDTALLGRFRIERPKLFVVLRDGGSNLEDLLAAYLEPSDEPTAVSVALEIVDGSVSISDQTTGRTWQIEDLGLTLTTSPGATGSVQVETSGTIVDTEHPGRFKIELAVRQGDSTDSSSTAAGELSVDATAVPLAMFDAVLGRLVPKMHLDGRLAGRIGAQWGGQQTITNMAIEADVTADVFSLAAPPLGTDRVELEQLRATCHVVQDGRQLEIRPSALGCDLGEIRLAGQIDLGELQSGPLLDSTLRQTCQVEGRLDLARLARMLPQTLRIREGTQITSGQVELTLSSRGDPQGIVWRGQLQASDLAGAHAGRQLAWEKPVRIVLAARQSGQGPVVENLRCESDFFQLHAAGTPQEMTASASFSLEPLAQQLGQFVDLGGLGLEGDGWAKLDWKRSAERQFRADAELQIRNFRLAMPERPAWSEESLHAHLAASGRTDLGANTQLQEASLELAAGADRIDARLTQPVPDLRNGGTWPVEVTMTGRLQPWPARMRTWTNLGEWSMAGNYELTAQAAASGEAVSVRRATLTVQQFQLTSPEFHIDEPNVGLVASGDYGRPSGVLQLEQLAITSAALGADVKGRIVQAGDRVDLDLSGQISYDMEKLARLLRPYIGPSVQIVGTGSSPAWYRGPLSPAKAQAAAGASWQWANVYGFQTGPGDLKATLGEGIVRVEPLDLVVSQGRVTLAPQVRLAPEPIELTVPPGPLARHVQITPTMCDEALKYIAPVLAGVTAAQGAFSIEIDACRIPLGSNGNVGGDPSRRPDEGELAGKFIIHSVEIGPGPLIQELAVLLGRASPAKLRRESVIRFQMADGRVYHQGLELVFPDLTIRTHGSVGTDQTLALVAEMPVPPKWIGTNVLGSALRGQTIQLPIGGTLSRPRIDRRVLEQLSRQFLEKATRNLIEDELGNQLDRLFGPR